MPDEIQKLGNKVILAFYSEEEPILCARVNSWQRSEWQGKWDQILYERTVRLIRFYRAETFINV